eukprot:TRINITY_DN79415_c0_g1_i1.p1 TRINITY_DN79415_c0_g1~~TRINITY_DN79415_c0_g1_i1.p1  ORF type:complete len:281 (+),score=44.28 TRINITY_DN79415_c0_g1_i1:66-908(+)
MGAGLSSTTLQRDVNHEFSDKTSLTCSSSWRSTGSESSDDSTPQWNHHRVSDTVIIFDWDDTLLCSTAINYQQYSPNQLHQLENVIRSIIWHAMQFGETMIITNGNATWVQDSMRRFLPGLASTLDRIKVMSARAAYEASFPGDPYAWKRQAFKEIFAQRRDSGLHSQGVNLVVLGDSPAEIEAARHCTKVLNGTSQVKTVKFKEMPSVNELIGELKKVQQDLGKICQEEGSYGRALALRSFPANVDKVSCYPSAWKLLDTESCESPTYRGFAASFFVGA